MMEGFDISKPPFLNAINFKFWKARMKLYIQSLNIDLWDIVVDGFMSKSRKEWNEHDKRLFSLNIKAMHIFYSALNEHDYARIKCCSNAKDIWDTLHNLYNVVEVVNIDSFQEIVQDDETCSISLDDDQHEIETEDENLQEYFVNNEKEEDSPNEPTKQRLENPQFTTQKDLEVNYNPKLCNSLSYEKLSYAFDESHESISINLECSSSYDSKLENNSFVENSTCESSKSLKEKDFKKNFKNHNSRYHYNKRLKFSNNILHKVCMPIICNYCGHEGHISHLCPIRRNSYVRQKYTWIPKGFGRQCTNVKGPKLIWVPKSSPSTSILQKTSQPNRQTCQETEELSRRASQVPKDKLIKSKTYKKKKWVRKLNSSNTIAKVSNYITSYLTIFDNH